MEPSGTILLIEDDRELRKVLRDLLESMGHGVIAAPGAEKAPIVFDGAASADLLVADVTVPGTASEELAAALLARHRGLGALLISTNDRELEVRRRFRDGRTRFLVKPFSIEELRDAAIGARSRGAAVAGRGRRRASK